MSVKVRRLEGVLTLDVNGVPNREGSGKLTVSRLKLIKSDHELSTKEGSNHIKAKVTPDGKSLTSSACINRAMISKYLPRINANDNEVDYSKYCSSIAHLLAGNVRTADGKSDEAFQRSKSLKLSDAVDKDAGHVFIDTKVNNISKRDESGDKSNSGFRTQENAGKREQVADVMLDIQNLSVFLFEEMGDASTKHCPVSGNNLEKTLEGLRNLFRESGVSDVSNIRDNYRVALDSSVNNISFKGVLFTDEQVLVLIKAAFHLLKTCNLFNSHGSFKTKSIVFYNEEGVEVDISKLKAGDIVLEHVVATTQNIIELPMKKEKGSKKAA